MKTKKASVVDKAGGVIESDQDIEAEIRAVMNRSIAPVLKFQAEVKRLRSPTIQLRPSTKAVLALIKHLRQAKEDPDIKSCPEIHDIVEGIIKEIGSAKITDTRIGEGLAKVISRPKARRTNAKNAKATRKKDEKNVAKERFDAWANNPKLYANQTKYIEAVFNKLTTPLKPDEKTIRTWFREFLEQARSASSLSESAKAKFKKYK